MAKPSHRSDIVEAGLRVMFKKGFHGAGVRDIVAEAGVPQGSFTNHFPSKEAFASEVLDHYLARTMGLVGQALSDRSVSPRRRLLRYLDIITDRLAADRFTRGCLIGDFSIELSQPSEFMRERLARVYREWLTPFEKCIAEGQKNGELDDRFSPRELAEFLLSSWEGAILRMKVERNAKPLERFKRIAFATVFARKS